MTKKQFLKKLKENIESLNLEEQERILKEYEELIDEKIKSGKKEKEAVKDFGNVEELANGLIRDYEKNNHKENDIIGNFSKKVLNYGERFLEFLSQKDTKELIGILIEILIVIFLISLCHIPVAILEELGKSVFYILSSPVNHVFYVIWKVVLELAYLALSILAFGKFIGRRYFNEDIPEKEIKEKKSKELKEYENNLGLSLIKLGVIFFKFLAIIVLFGISMYLMGMGLILGICLYLIIHGVTYFGLYLVMVSLFILGIIFFKLLFDFVLDRKFRGSKILVSLVTCFVFLGFGCALATSEVASTSFINQNPPNLEMETLNEEKPFTNNIILVGNISDYVIDNDLNNIVIMYNYYPIGTKMSTKITKEENEVYLNYKYDEFKITKELINQMLLDLKEKKIYNYYLEPQIIVKSNEENINIIKKNRQKYYHNNKEYLTCEFVRTYKVLDIIKGSKEDYSYVTLSSFLDDEIYTAKIKNNLINNLLVDNYYEFTFQTYQSYIDTDIDDVFKDSNVIRVTKTDKLPSEQINDNSCRVFY